MVASFPIANLSSVTVYPRPFYQRTSQLLCSAVSFIDFRFGFFSLNPDTHSNKQNLSPYSILVGWESRITKRSIFVYNPTYSVWQRKSIGVTLDSVIIDLPLLFSLYPGITHDLIGYKHMNKLRASYHSQS